MDLSQVLSQIRELNWYRELSLRVNTSHHINVALYTVMFCVLMVFAAGIEQTKLYAGCVIVSVLIHYFSLVTVRMWKGAEAVLMFHIAILSTSVYKYS